MDKKDLKPIFLNTTRKKLVQFEKNFDGKLDLALVNFDVTWSPRKNITKQNKKKTHNKNNKCA